MPVLFSCRRMDDLKKEMVKQLTIALFSANVQTAF